LNIWSDGRWVSPTARNVVGVKLMEREPFPTVKPVVPKEIQVPVVNMKDAGRISTLQEIFENFGSRSNRR
jgi:hypothetical protein